MRCGIWCHFQNLKKHGNHPNPNPNPNPNPKPATSPKVKLLHGCISRFLNYANGTKSSKASHINIKKYRVQR